MTKEDVLLINRYQNTPGVYCLTYEINGEKYIGSSVAIGRRIWGGMLSYNNIVINKNWEYMSLSILEITPTKNIENLRYLEEKWIQKLNTYYPNGMNVSSPTNHLDQKYKCSKVIELPLIQKNNKEIKKHLSKYRFVCSASTNEKMFNKKNLRSESKEQLQKLEKLSKLMEKIDSQVSNNAPLNSGRESTQ